MKRLAVVIVLVVVIAMACTYACYRVGKSRERMETYVGAIFTAVDRKDTPAVQAGVKELSLYWKKEGTALIRYVRHAHIDEVTRAVARLEPLARYEEYSELSAELSFISWQMEHIWKAELPKLSNVL